MGPQAHGVWQAGCIALSFVGVIIRCVTVGYVAPGTSGRSTQEMQASALNETGMYSIVRHPLYLGNFLAMLGLTLALCVWWLVLLYGLAFLLYYERIMLAEEVFLRDRFGERYQTWAAHTPAFIPRLGLGGWRAPEGRFSLKRVLRRENSGLFALLVAFAFVEAAMRLAAGRRPVLPGVWWTALVLGVAAYTTLLILKRRTWLL